MPDLVVSDCANSPHKACKILVHQSEDKNPHKMKSLQNEVVPIKIL